MTITESRNF